MILSTIPANSLAALPLDMRPQTAPMVWQRVFNLLPDSGRVLNAGAGRGGMSLLLDQHGYRVTSVDLHPDHFQVGHLTCQFADLNKPLALGEEGFDAVLAVEVFEHLENPWGFLREALRVLKDGGSLIFTTPNLSNIASRVLFLFEGLFPYFREESFHGCYHVTPIFNWSVERACRTSDGVVEKVLFSRVDWPTKSDVPRYDEGIRRKLLNLLPLNHLTGEVACYVVKKKATAKMEIGLHYK